MKNNEAAEVQVVLRRFARIKTRNNLKVVQVEERKTEAVEHPEQCTLYFFDSYVGIVDGVEYRFGPELNVSKPYFFGGDYYPNTVIFRHYYMRCYGWKDEDIANEDLPSWSPFFYLTQENYPQGVLIVDNEIINPKDGIMVSFKESFDKERVPSKEVISAHLS